jgi:uncharacterized membrane-anchored protein YjiN (DUF445 family)
MNPRKRLLYIAVWLLICVLVGWIATYFFSLNFWVAFGITAAALVLNGIVVEIEDRMPGGFLNPRKRK